MSPELITAITAAIVALAGLIGAFGKVIGLLKHNTELTQQLHDNTFNKPSGAKDNGIPRL